MERTRWHHDHQPLRRVIVMEPIADLNLIGKLKERGIAILLVAPGSCLPAIDCSHTAILLQDFEEHKMSLRHKSPPYYVGAPYLRALLAQTTHVTIPYPPRSLYGNQLANCTLVIKMHTARSEDSHMSVNQNYWRAKYLGATVVREMSAKITHLLTDRTFGKDYDVATSLGKTVVDQEWINDIWENHRNRIDSLDKDSILLKKHTLPCFTGMTIYFVGIKNEMVLENYELLTRDYGANVCDYPSRATHIVVGNDVDLNQGLPFEIGKQFVVTLEWFDESIRYGGARNAESFQLFPRYERYEKIDHCLEGSASRATTFSSGRSRYSSQHSTGVYVPYEDGIPEENVSLTSIPMPKMDKVTIQIYAELVALEDSYVKALQRLSMLNETLIERLPNGYNREIQQMFGKIHSILAVHELILRHCRRCLEKPDANFGMVDIWVHFKAELARYYPPYVNFYDAVSFNACYDNLMATNVAFHDIVKEAERRPDWERLRVKDLLIMPVQHLMQTQLIFNEGIKKAVIAKRDIRKLSDAAKCIEQINRGTNSSKTRIENSEKHLRALKDIRDLPPSLISFHRELIISASMRLLAGSESWANERRPMRLFLLDDCLIICKVRRNETSGTLRRMRSAVFSSDMQQEPPQKLRYQQHYSLDKIRGIHSIGLMQAPVYVLIIREPMSSDMELTFVVENTQDSAENVKALMETMRKKIISLHERDVYEEYEETTGLGKYPVPAVLNTLKHSQLLSTSRTSLASNSVTSQCDRVSLFGSRQQLHDDAFGSSHDLGVRRMSLQEQNADFYPSSLLESSRQKKQPGRIRRTLSNISLALTRPFRRHLSQSASAACSRTNSICGNFDSPTVSLDCFPCQDQTTCVAWDTTSINEEDEEGPSNAMNVNIPIDEKSPQKFRQKGSTLHVNSFRTNSRYDVQ
ncbi:unnamed protein product, partial [Mesorhabditis belari]|uniref:DH domain-containing protein n=1 Tax=Mesorhabditis belari TaxID=2138241 RepID=A0AAF3F0Q9_9BILA